MDKFQEIKFRDYEDSPDYFLWQVFSNWQKSKNNLIEKYNLTSPQMTVLTALYWLCQNGLDTIQNDIANAANMDKMTLSSVVRTLAKKNLVYRINDKNDSRAKRVLFTNSGLDIIIKALKEVDKHNINYFNALGNSKIRFINDLQKILKINKMVKDYVATYETTVNAPIDIVWDALINPKIVKQYFFGTKLTSDWKVGSKISFSGEYEGQPYEDKGEILVYEHEKELQYSYLSNFSNLADKPENYLWVMYKVEPTDNGTKLTISQSNYDQEKADHSAGNWAGLIDGMKKIIE